MELDEKLDDQLADERNDRGPDDDERNRHRTGSEPIER